MDDSFLKVLSGAVIALATLWLQGIAAERGRRRQFELEKKKIFWNLDLEFYKELEILLAFFVYDSGHRYQPEEVGSEDFLAHQRKIWERFEELGKYQIRVPEIGSFLGKWAELKYWEAGVNMAVESGNPPKKLEEAERSKVREELVEEARRLLESVRSSVSGESLSTEGLSRISFENLWQQIRSKFPWNAGRSNG